MKKLAIALVLAASLSGCSETVVPEDQSQAQETADLDPVVTDADAAADTAPGAEPEANLDSDTTEPAVAAEQNAAIPSPATTPTP